MGVLLGSLFCRCVYMVYMSVERVCIRISILRILVCIQIRLDIYTSQHIYTYIHTHN